jgi:Cu2+-exporting ATPase
MRRPSSPRRRVDIAVSYPRDGRLLVTSRYFFADPSADACRRFVGRLFGVAEVCAIEILPARAGAQIDYRNGVVPGRTVVQKIARHLLNGHDGGPPAYLNSPTDLPLAAGRDGWRVERHGPVLSTWEIAHALPGRIRFRNRLIRGKPGLCAAIERALAQVPGVRRFTTNARTATVLILHDRRRAPRHQLLQILDRALAETGPAERGDAAARPARGHGPEVSLAKKPFAGQGKPWARRDFTIGALSLGVSAMGDAVYPPLSMLGVPGAVYTARETFSAGLRSLVRDRTVSVDTLVISAHVLSVMGGYYALFCLNNFVYLCARNLLDKVKGDSRADYTDLFRQEARTVWLRVNGAEVETPLDAVKVGDLVSTAAGETIPVDGHIADGAATIDQHLLTGEAAPAERGVGDAVFALTVVLSGKIWIRVEKTGAATAAAQIARVLSNTVDFKTGRQLRAERLSDRLAVPAFLCGLGAWPVLGLGASAALLDAHPKYRTTLASSLGLLNYFRLAAREGLLIKDGRSLELLSEVDTVVFDKTGTLTLGQPHVRRLYARAPHGGDDILKYAAAAEQRQSHPVATAIMHAARARGLFVPAIDEAEYKAGYGLSVTVEGSAVRVGSARFMEMEGIAMPPPVVDLQARCHGEGHSLVLVAVEGRVAGAIELHTTIRPEARAIVQGLRRRHITSMYIISGDHEAPTRRLAETLGIEHYFAETLPENKAALIERLQQAGKVTCYVGDGINDSIAMKKSHVSVSLSGASTLAVDTAEVILLDGSLNQLGRLFDIAGESQANTTTAMAAIIIPGLVCVGGVLLGFLGFSGARLLNLGALVGGLGAAMLPLITHAPARPPSTGWPEPPGRETGGPRIEEHPLD